MQKSKVAELLSTLTKKELKRFGDYIESPFFNKNKKITTLFQFIKKYHPDFTHPKCTKEKAFVLVFDKLTYSDQKFRNIMSELAKQLEQFLLFLELETQPTVQDYWLLHSFHRRNLHKQFLHKHNTIKKGQDQQNIRDANYYKQNFRLHELAYGFNLLQKDYIIDTGLQQVVNNFDYYYLITQLKYYCAIYNMQISRAGQYDAHLLEAVLTYLSTRDLTSLPAIAIYYRLLLVLKEQEKSEAQYPILKKLLSKNGKILIKAELRQIYTAMFNYCNRKLKEGKESYLREIFELYQVMAAQSLLINEHGYIRYNYFRNAIMAALRLNEIEWAEQFLAQFKSDLQPEYQENVLNYCLAAIDFYKQNYKQTLQYLLQFEFQGAYHYMDHKILLLKTYYELDETEALIALVHATRNWLRRNQTMSEQFLLTYHNFIKSILKLGKARHNPDAKREELLEELLNMEVIAEKEWLVRKSYEL